MDCPKCVGVLKKQRVEDIEVDACPVCEGIWFDAGELEAIIKKDARDFDYIDVGKEAFDGKELAALDLNSKQGKCPRCQDGTMLTQAQYEKNQKLRVDLCPRGHGLWLDGGEIQMLRRRGLVKLTDWTRFQLEFLQFAFSKNGFKYLTSRIRGRGRGR